MKAIMAGLGERLNQKSVNAVASLESNLFRIMLGWVAFVLLAGTLRTVFAVSPIDSSLSLIQTIAPYILLGTAPIAAFWIADQVFPRGALMQQPEIRFARYGKWRDIDVLSARSNPMFGPTGIMASLVIGMLINVPIRSLEFLTAVPAMNRNAPIWGQALFVGMAIDVIVMNFLYVFCFVAALRCAPWFPRLLVMTWCLDITSQIAMAHAIGSVSELPHSVGASLGQLLSGNVQKVLISVAIWLPYLLLSERVNLTYRNRLIA